MSKKKFQREANKDLDSEKAKIRRRNRDKRGIYSIPADDQ